jgi:Ala-tRNA(Pro) deacylase
MSSVSAYHPVVSKIVTLLQTHQVWFETFEHQPVRTSEEAAQIRDGYTLHQGAKALLVRVKISNADKKFMMLVIPGDFRFEVAKVKALFAAKDIRFATEAEVDELTGGVQPGGVPPFGNLFGLEVIVDPAVLKNDKIIFNAGDRRFSVGMNSSDYQQLVKPRVETITTLPA